MHHVSALTSRAPIRSTNEDLVRGLQELELHHSGLKAHGGDILGLYLTASMVLLMDPTCTTHWADYNSSCGEPPDLATVCSFFEHRITTFSAMKKKHLCSNCLSRGHSKESCQSKRTCRECSGRHHTLLHKPDNSSFPSTTDQPRPQGTQVLLLRDVWCTRPLLTPSPGLPSPLPRRVLINSKPGLYSTPARPSHS